MLRSRLGRNVPMMRWGEARSQLLDGCTRCALVPLVKTGVTGAKRNPGRDVVFEVHLDHEHDLVSWEVFGGFTYP